jgi:hypothetical protein
MMRQLQQSSTFGDCQPVGTRLVFVGHELRPIAAYKSFAVPPAVTEFPRRPDADAINESIPLFYIGQNRKGAWVVREAEGRSGGLFLFKQSAVRFARRQSEPQGCAIMYLAGPIELDIDGQGRCAVPLSTVEKAAKQMPLVVRLAALITGAWRKIAAVSSHNAAALRRHRTAAEQELFGGRYTLTSKNDDDLPVWH